MRAMYGCRVIEYLSTAKLYHDVKKFAKHEYSPLLEREFQWKTESAFLDLHCYELLQLLVDQGQLDLGVEKVRVVTLSDEIGGVVNKLVQNRCYALALDLNEKAKLNY